MGIYIKEMEMPKSCWRCTLCKMVDCAISLGEEPSSNFKDKRHPNCPLIHIPEPHGRLIDADVLLEESKKDGAFNYVDSWQIVDTPTVIEGSE